MNEIQKVYEVAYGELGYLEKASSAQLDSKTGNAGYNNYTKYWRDTRKRGRMKAYGYAPESNFTGGKDWPYCAAGIDDTFCRALGQERAAELLLHGNAAFINCQTMYQKAKDRGLLVNSPKPGVIVLFYNSRSVHYHTEYCYKVENGVMYTIGFNTSGASSVVANGGGVCAKKYTFSKTAAHYFMPAYEKTTEILPELTDGSSVTLLKKGSSGDAVKDMQEKLICLDYYCGPEGADGDFGNNTYRALKEFQKDYNLTVDGIYGENSDRELNIAYQVKKNQQTSVPDKQQLLFNGKCTGNGVNVRIWAGTEHGNISAWPKLNKGNDVEVLNYTQTAKDGYKWYYVRIAGKWYGFVHSKYIQKT